MDIYCSPKNLRDFLRQQRAASTSLYVSYCVAIIVPTVSLFTSKSYVPSEKVRYLAANRVDHDGGRCEILFQLVAPGPRKSNDGLDR